MKKKTLLLLSAACTLVSCNNNNNPESESEIESNKKVEVYSDDTFYWNFLEGQCLSKTLKFGVSSYEEEKAFKLKVDGKEISPDSKNNLDFKLFYETKNCNSDNANNASDYIYLNNNKLGRLQSKVEEGYPILFKDVNIGQNIISITAGGWYGGREFSENYAVDGKLDDFFISNVYLQLSTGEKLSPTKMVFYKGVKGLTKYNKKTVTYQDGVEYKIGDGWSGNLAYDGHPDPLYDIPQKIDFYFEYIDPVMLKTYTLDTTKYNDGGHYVTLEDTSENIMCQNNVIIDNNGPSITISANDEENLSSSEKIHVVVEDKVSGISVKSIKLDGKEIEGNDIDLSSVSNGNHNIVVYGKDGAGNYTYNYRNINVNQYASQEIDKLSGKKVDASLINNNIEINVSDTSKKLTVSVNASNQDNEIIAYKALNNQTGKYDILATGISNNEVKFEFNPTNYVSNNKVTIIPELLYSKNGNANTLYWSSDTQYLPKVEFNDINKYYGQLMNYVVNKYQDNTISYYMHTGDIVDDNPSYAEEDVRAEWENATVAFKILDDANVPYGTSAGNHDVGTDINNLDYIYFNEYFGINRFNESSVYGGSLNDNNCHYDLVSFGDYDFIIMYLGFGQEVTDETLGWVNKTLEKYRHRNAIIATHGYLNENGVHDTHIQAEEIYNEIALKNENVRFICSGHTDGSFCVKQTAPSGRVFYEILNCYQFYESQKYNVKHVINGYNCNGEGYMKSIQFNQDGNVKITTFSPILNTVKDPYSGSAFVNIQLDLLKANRIVTVNSFEVKN